jgi:hypothetical protein
LEAVHQDVIPMTPVPQPVDWFSLIGKYGFTTALAVVLLWYLAAYIVEPMRRDQQRFMDSVIETNKINAATVAKQTEIQQQQAQALKDIVPVLQQIRDDQRRGVWLDSPKGSGT